jgi:hypothetical protein
MEERLSPVPAEQPGTAPIGPLVIGWREYVAFPEWNVRRVKVKVDTGARTSALDVAGYELLHEDGQGLLAELRVVLNRKKPHQLKLIRVPVLGMIGVRNSTGTRQERPLIETTIQLGPVVKRVRLTITDRARMRFRMILGRKALEHDFLVDVSRQYLFGRKSIQK